MRQPRRRPLQLHLPRMSCLADHRLYRQRALLQRERLDDPLLERSALDSERRGRRAAGLPLPLTPSLSVATFVNGAPRAFSMGVEENLSTVVGALPAGATLLSAFGEPAEAADKLLRLTRGGTAALVDAHAVRSRARSPSPGPSPNPSCPSLTHTLTLTLTRCARPRARYSIGSSTRARCARAGARALRARCWRRTAALHADLPRASEPMDHGRSRCTTDHCVV